MIKSQVVFLLFQVCNDQQLTPVARTTLLSDLTTEFEQAYRRLGQKITTNGAAAAVPPTERAEPDGHYMEETGSNRAQNSASSAESSKRNSERPLQMPNNLDPALIEQMQTMFMNMIQQATAGTGKTSN